MEICALFLVAYLMQDISRVGSDPRLDELVLVKDGPYSVTYLKLWELNLNSSPLEFFSAGASAAARKVASFNPHWFLLLLCASAG